MTDGASHFPDALLVPLRGDIVFHDPARGQPTGGTWAIEIPLAPFSADDQYSTTWRAGLDGPDVIRTSVDLELIHLPAETLDGLAGSSFTFPVNPEPGYIDGSIYLGAAHNPVDVTKIKFGAIDGHEIDAEVTAVLNFEFELYGVQNRDATLATRLTFRRVG